MRTLAFTRSIQKYSKSPMYELQVVNFQKRECVCQPRYASCYTLLFKVLYCKVKNVFVCVCVCLFLSTYYLCEKYYKPTKEQYWFFQWSCMDVRVGP